MGEPRKSHVSRLASLKDVGKAVRRVCHRLDRLMIKGHPCTTDGSPLDLSTEDFLQAARTQVYALKVLGELIRDVDLEARVRELEASARARAS